MRQFRTYGSVGALGGRPPRATRFDNFPSKSMNLARAKERQAEPDLQPQVQPPAQHVRKFP